MDIAMVVIPSPAEGTRTVMTRGDGTGSPFIKPDPFFTGTGTVNYVCGGCEVVLAKGLSSASQIGAMVLHCPACGSYNETRT